MQGENECLPFQPEKDEEEETAYTEDEGEADRDGDDDIHDQSGQACFAKLGIERSPSSP